MNAVAAAPPPPPPPPASKDRAKFWNILDWHKADGSKRPPDMVRADQSCVCGTICALVARAGRPAAHPPFWECTRGTRGMCVYVCVYVCVCSEALVFLY